MGCFSFTRADTFSHARSQHLNILDGDDIRLLVPDDFGGGSLEGTYLGYGRVEFRSAENTADLYEVLAFWNSEMPYQEKKVLDFLQWDGEFPNVKFIDENTDMNRILGIKIGCYRNQVKQLQFPLKLVLPTCKLSYEEIPDRSYGDPLQGFAKLSWEEYQENYPE